MLKVSASLSRFGHLSATELLHGGNHFHVRATCPKFKRIKVNTCPKLQKSRSEAQDHQHTAQKLLKVPHNLLSRQDSTSQRALPSLVKRWM